MPCRWPCSTARLTPSVSPRSSAETISNPVPAAVTSDGDGYAGGSAFRSPRSRVISPSIFLITAGEDRVDTPRVRGK